MFELVRYVLLDDTCDGVRCEEYQVCKVGDSGVQCVCPECTEEEKATGPVCSTKLNTHVSLCALKLHSCERKSNERLLSHGHCKQGGLCANALTNKIKFSNDLCTHNTENMVYPSSYTTCIRCRAVLRMPSSSLLEIYPSLDGHHFQRFFRCSF